MRKAMPIVVAPDGVRLKYDVVGAGPPLLLHLGAGCDSGLWDAAGYLRPLSGSYRCILFDHRGHGESDHPTDVAAYHIDRLANDVVSVLDDLGIPSAGFWSYSNGISVGLRVADRYPGRLTYVIASGGYVGRVGSDEQLAAAVSSAVANYREHGWEKLIAGFAADEGPAPEWMQERIRATDIEPVIAWSQARLDWHWNSWDALSRINSPILFLIGELEDPDDEMSAAVAEAPHGRLIRIPGKGHINAFLDSSYVLPHVQAFLVETLQAPT
jgi:pimeloyl-ACP methyl ester carboxylesterase